MDFIPHYLNFLFHTLYCLLFFILAEFWEFGKRYDMSFCGSIFSQTHSSVLFGRKEKKYARHKLWSVEIWNDYVNQGLSHNSINSHFGLNLGSLPPDTFGYHILVGQSILALMTLRYSVHASASSPLFLTCCMCG